MTIFLICMIPVSGFLGFMTCALLQIAGAADRQEEQYRETHLHNTQGSDHALQEP